MKKLLLLSVLAFVSFGVDLSKAQTDDHPFAGAPTQYSVAVVTAQKTGAALTMWMYVDQNKRRTEQETNNGRLVLILRGDLNLMYTIIVSHKAYRVAPLDPTLLESLGTYEVAKDMMLSHEKVGTETVKGEVCDKYHFSSPTDKNKSSHGLDRATSGYIWISQSTHFPVMSKTETATTSWENLEIGPQEPSLFEPPTGYKRIDQ
jgi:hypothetical protein